MALGAVASMPVATQAQTGWLPTVNAYRASAGLPPVSEDASQSAGDLAHAQYMVQNNTGGHSEDPTQPGFSAGGATAAQQSNVVTTSRPDTSDEDAVGLWMVSPFHAVGIVDPNLTTTGYGSARATKAGVQMGAALNVIAGRSKSPKVTGAVMWPGDGASVPLTSYPGNEAPDPLSACAGYTAPSGLPIILETGGAAAVTAAAISDAVATLPSCEFDGSNYANPVAGDQANGRAILAARGAVILIPRAPLSAGKRYTVTETVNNTTYKWTFGAGLPGLPTAASRPTFSPPHVPVAAAPPAGVGRPVIAPTTLPTPTPLAAPLHPPRCRPSKPSPRGEGSERRGLEWSSPRPSRPAHQAGPGGGCCRCFLWPWAPQAGGIAAGPDSVGRQRPRGFNGCSQDARSRRNGG